MPILESANTKLAHFNTLHVLTFVHTYIHMYVHTIHTVAVTIAHKLKPDIVCHCMIHLQYPAPNPILFHRSQCSSSPSRPWAGTSLCRVQRCAPQPSPWCTREGTWCGCQSDGGHAGSCKRQSTLALWRRTDWVCPEGRERGSGDYDK